MKVDATTKFFEILNPILADYSKKNIPITAPLKNSQLSKDYEYNTGKAIKDCLKINKLDRTITTLPWNYSYGLSIINTHLVSVSKIVLS